MAGLPVIEHTDYSKTVIDDIRHLASPYLLGDFAHCELIQIFGINKKEYVNPVNIYSLAVFEEFDNAPYGSQNVTPALFQIPGLEDWSFGIEKSKVALDMLYTVIDSLLNQKQYNLTGIMHTGHLVVLPRKFVPARQVNIPVNSLLKNNFWNGSYLFEFFSQEKKHLQIFFKKPSLLQDISKIIEKYIPITLAINSDRLGSIIIQLPVKCMVWDILMFRDGSLVINTNWRESKYKRLCRISIESEYDNIINDAAIFDINQTSTTIRGNFDGIEKATLWDVNNRIVLGQMSSFYDIKEINVQIDAITAEPRTVKITERDGSTITSFRVPIIHRVPAGINARPANDITSWTRQRKYKEKIEKVNKSLEFVQYHNGDNQKACDDLAKLINRYGYSEVCLWDPFLEAQDIMHTLFRCSFSSSKLRALGSRNHKTAGVFKQTDPQTILNFGQWKEKQRKLLSDPGNNQLALNLEFRISRGQAGFPFHDRFLIFPETNDGPKAWSLGISVNALGNSHHILQSASNPQMIVDAFFNLWDSIRDTDNHIWRCPNV